MRHAAALLALALSAAPAVAQPADTTAIRHTITQASGPVPGGADAAIVGPVAPPPARYGSGGVALVSSDFQALPHEAAVFAGEGTLGILVTSPLARRAVSPTSAVGVTATGALGTRRAAGGVFGTAGVASDYVLASAGAGVWAERSPAGRAFGPAVEARVRPFFFVRAEAGAVVAGARAWWTRLGADVPLLLGGGVLPFVGLTVETRHFADTGRSLRTYGVSLQF